MTEQRCKLTKTLVSHCSHCLNVRPEIKALRLRANRLATGTWFPAQNGSTCVSEGCGQYIHPGALERWNGTGWVGECCAEEAATSAR